jgi:hypothetical protein
VLSRSDAARGIRWAGVGLALVVGVLAIQRLASGPSANPEEAHDAPAEVVVGEPITVAPVAVNEPEPEKAAAPPQVPPPPPLPGERRQAPKAKAAPPPPPPPPPPAPKPSRPVLARPRIWNAEPSPGMAAAPAVDPADPAKDAPQTGGAGSAPTRPVIIRPIAENEAPNAAVKVLKSVGRVFGLGRSSNPKETASQDPSEPVREAAERP